MPLINPGGGSAGNVQPLLDDYPVLATERGFKAWTYDPAIPASQLTLTSGRLIGAQLFARKAISVTKLHAVVATGASSVTSARIGIYNAAGALQSDADISTMLANTIQFSATLGSAVAIPAGSFFICMYVAATTPGAIRAGGPAASANASDGGLDPRFFLADTGLTSMPATIGAKTASNSFWFGAS